MEMSSMGPGLEFDLVRSFLKDAPPLHSTVRVGPGDDCTVIGNIALSTDASIEDVHFRRDWLSAEEIGWRATAAALSDLAAVAAEPIGVMISLGVPNADRVEFAGNVMRGVVQCLKASGACLLGGDTTGSERLMIDVVVVGRSTRPVLRSHARAGDELWVTGVLGGSAAAVAALQAGTPPNAAARARYAHPTPRVREARWLQRHTQIHAMIDLSDGLNGDAAHIAAASGCSVVIDKAAVPVDVESGATYEQAVAGGEDYEICFAAGPGTVEHVRLRFEGEFGVRLTRIGHIEAGAEVLERSADGSTVPVTARAYQHFKESSAQ